jgi:cobalt-zinc-cadmium efflux system outer membrane protein
VKYLTKKHWQLPVMLVAFQLIQGGQIGAAQTVAPNTDTQNQIAQHMPALPARYVDAISGMTADEAVAYALEHNGELSAVRKEVEAARGLVKQAGLRANPKVDLSVSQNVIGADRNITANGMLPLEIGGRRPARVLVAQREAEIRKLALADRERLLAADVRQKFGEAIAANLKLGFDQEIVATGERRYNLLVARVADGRSAPLDQNIVLVELNRVRSVKEQAEGKVQIAMIELRNLLGMTPEDPLRLKGDFNDLAKPLPPVNDATTSALANRPDLQLARAAEKLAEARIEDARAQGRADMSLTAGYQLMKNGFAVNGFDDAGQLKPVQGNFHYVTFGVSLDLPVRNKNQGSIEAAMAESEAAKRRREFGELTIRKEVAAAYAQYNSAARAAEIYRVGVIDQSSKNVDVVKQVYEYGAKSLIDYIGEQRQFIDLENNYIDSLLDTYKGRVEVERAVASPITNAPMGTHE